MFSKLYRDRENNIDGPNTEITRFFFFTKGEKIRFFFLSSFCFFLDKFFFFGNAQNIFFFKITGKKTNIFLPLYKKIFVTLFQKKVYLFFDLFFFCHSKHGYLHP